MAFPDSVFTVIEEKDCPMYEVGDRFKLMGNAILVSRETTKEFVTTSIVQIPPQRQVCRNLVADITRVLIRYERVNQIPDCYLSCTGCEGLLRLAYKKWEATHLPQETAEQRKRVARLAKELGDFSLFQSLDKQSIRDLVSLLHQENFETGDTIIKKGEPGKNLYIILEGEVEVLDENENRILALKKGEIFGEMSLISGEPVGATIRVIKPLTVLYIRGNDFIKAMDRYPPLQMYFARLLAQRLAQSNVERAEEFSSGMAGKLSEMPPAELFQTLNINQKTGVLELTYPDNRSAKLYFHDGELVRARLGKKEGKEAFFDLFNYNQGRFKFIPGLDLKERDLAPIGFFMELLMDGVRRVDEQIEP